MAADICMELNLHRCMKINQIEVFFVSVIITKIAQWKKEIILL